jgi:hypothetical protein
MFSNLNIDNNVFPERKKLKPIIEFNNHLYNDILEQVKKVELDNIDFSKMDFAPKARISQIQKIYFWIRVYLKEEIEITENTDIKLTWVPSGENILAKFICFSKKGLDKDMESQVTNYNPEDDKKVLCLMVDEERININNQDIPFIKKLFKIGRYYENQVWKKEEMILTKEDGSKLPWFDIDF